MRIISWNVNGLRSIYRKGLTDFLIEHQPDLLLLQEIKAFPDQLAPEERNPNNYSAIFSPATKKGYSGVAIYYRQDLPLEVINLGIGIPEFDQEGRFIIAKLGEYLIYNIYFPSGTSGEIRQKFKEDFLVAISKHLQGLDPKHANRIIIGGDFNICHREIDIHHPQQATKLGLSGFLPQERSWFDSFLALGLIDSFRSHCGDIKDRYSWWTYRAGARSKNLGWRIDYLLVNQAIQDRILKADILSDCVGSDHAPILLDLKE